MTQAREQGSEQRYVRWTGHDLALQDGAVEEWTEVSPDGVVQREIAFDLAGKVVHMFPSEKYREGRYGHFDLTPVSNDQPSNGLIAAEFARRWDDARQSAESLAPPPSDIEEFWHAFGARIKGPRWLPAVLTLITAVTLIILAIVILGIGPFSAVYGK